MGTSGIDSVLRAMDSRLDRDVATNDPRGYFTAVYRAVTARIAQGIDEGVFDDGDLMERFDVTFAGLFLEAADAYDRGARVSASWRIAFDHPGGSLLVLQHVLLGMNAHINLDLGVAAARTAPGTAIEGLERDFDHVNEVLCEMVDRMQDAIALTSPWTRTADRLAWRADEFVSRWSIIGAREGAWRFARTLSAAPDPTGLVAERDRRVAALGARIARPGPVVRPVAALARRRETADVRTVVDALRSTGAPVAG